VGSVRHYYIIYAVQAVELLGSVVVNAIAARRAITMIRRVSHSLIAFLSLFVVVLTAWFLIHQDFRQRLALGAGLGFVTIAVVWCGPAIVTILDRRRVAEALKVGLDERDGPLNE
jgi:hypothetical protein